MTHSFTLILQFRYIFFISIQVGVKYDNIAKVLGKEVYGEGLHVGPPGFSFIIFPSVFQTMQFRDITVRI